MAAPVISPPRENVVIRPIAWRSAFTLLLLVATPAACTDQPVSSAAASDAASFTYPSVCHGPWDCAILPIFVVCCASSAGDPDAGGSCAREPLFSDALPCGSLPQVCGSAGECPSDWSCTDSNGGECVPPSDASSHAAPGPEGGSDHAPDAAAE
jgi:hypothetical protein